MNRSYLNSNQLPEGFLTRYRNTTVIFVAPLTYLGRRIRNFMTKLLVMGQDDDVDISSEHGSQTPPTDTVAVLLAAGAGSRFLGSEHKLLATLPRSGGRSILEISLQQVLEAGFTTIVVVTGAADIPSGMLAHPSVTVVHNNRWAEGQSGSVLIGIHEAQRLEASAVVVGLADQPFVTAEAWRRVAHATAPIAVATYAGRRGNPVRLHESIWPLLPNSGDSGARDLIRLRPELVSQVDCPGSAADIDTQEDLAQWT
jgi:CTP:molybdopterin cytidylyltransferase MocA